jgi:hypothetical protein
VYVSLLGIIRSFRAVFLFALFWLFGTPIFLLPPKIENWSLYNQTIGSDYYLETIRPVSDKILGGSLRLFVRKFTVTTGLGSDRRINNRYEHSNYLFSGSFYEY